jgi:hypothetical protein
MDRHKTIRVLNLTWAAAGFFLLAFCLLGFAAAKGEPLYRDYGMHWPLQNRLAAVYGAVLFPVFGVVVALTLLLSEVFLRRVWMRWVLFVVFAFVLVYTFQALFLVPVS